MNAGAMTMSESASVWEKLGEMIYRRSPRDADRVNLHDTTLTTYTRVAYCAAHGEVVAVDRPSEGRFQCWCGDTVILRAEERTRRATAGAGKPQ